MILHKFIKDCVTHIFLHWCLLELEPSMDPFRGLKLHDQGDLQAAAAQPHQVILEVTEYKASFLPFFFLFFKTSENLAPYW